MAQRPVNIVWITTHDINPHLGTYSGIWPGADQAVTPHLDRLAEHGVRYDQAFATAPVCAPSRASVVTGCHPTAIGTLPMRTRAVPPAEVVLLPELFREHGYYVTNNFFTDFQMDVPGTTFDDIGAQAHWRNRPDNAPFFAAFHGMITHENAIYLPDEQFAAATSRVPDNLRHDPATVELPPYYPDSETFRTSWARYLDLITEMDLWVGDILAELDQDGLAQDTLVVFWSDHGLGMPRAKRWANEAGVRVPLIVRWPGVIAPGSSTTDPVSLIDLGPTMLSAAGFSVPDYMHGNVLLDSAGLRPEPNAYVVSGRERMDEQQDSSRTVRDARFRYIKHKHPDRSIMQHHAYADKFPTWAEFRELQFEEANQLAAGEIPNKLTPLQRSLVAASKPSEELFDILEDPHEERNLAGLTEYQEHLERLRAALAEWHAKYPDLTEIPEAELHEQWRPGGRKQQTAPVELSYKDGLIAATCATPGARIGYTTLPEQTDLNFTQVDHMLQHLGVYLDGRKWNVYTGPVTPENATYFRAWRIGYDHSEVIEAATSPTNRQAS